MVPLERNMETIPTTEDVKSFLSRIEGKAWDALDAADKVRAVELTATAPELSPEEAERLREVVPRPEDLSDEDRTLYNDTLERLGLLTKEER